MNTHFDELERHEKIERIEAGETNVLRLHGVVDRDIETATELREKSPDPERRGVEEIAGKREGLA